ncbi:arginine--tRNA ligase [Calditerrivibrio nitroreducens]|uniref:Arginine--tRNA ligase n=1 Tax=Calditerrivibrio nitroreducens TaxID=477976 RepID=A0A2J6WHV8_9BACT|nr:MAG: arginine--tRNA ligase [Calditerrivibrio nitroreducens]
MEDLIKEAIDKALRKYDLESVNYTIEIPKKSENGDFSSNVAFVLSKALKKRPLDIANEIVSDIDKKNFSKVEVAPPGFINFFLSKEPYYNFLRAIIEKPDFHIENIGNNKKAMVEFVSANPTGPLHIGHGRGSAYGDTIARLLKISGFDVYKEYYINDAGNQMNNLALSIYSRYCELFEKSYPFPADGYKGEYIIDIAKDIAKQYQDHLLNDETNGINVCFEVGVKTILNGIEADLRDFRVTFDNWFSEKSLYESQEVEKTIELLKKNGYIYEKDNALWFKSEQLGDDKDRVIKRSTGEYTYFASDIAYHKNKFERGFEFLVDVWGADHHGYVNRLKNGVKALGIDVENLKIQLIQMVSLIKGGERISMSTRAGEFITLRWLLDEVGTDAARYFYLMRDINSQFDFDIDLAKSKSNDNPVYYIQYAHARVCSLKRNATEKGIEFKINCDLELLTLPSEIEIIKKLYDFKNVVKTATINLEPHRICYYLQDLAGLFHTYYYNTTIVDENDLKTTNARLSLSEAVAKTISLGLNILGVSAPERM